MRARVTVYPHRAVLDPQGKAIRGALERLGFEEVEEVRAGKSFEIRLAVRSKEKAAERLRQMCEGLLANTVVEDYEIELVEEPGRERGTGDATAAGKRRAAGQKRKGAARGAKR
jgi:phosphoribosylformylglycinamidine synthase